MVVRAQTVDAFWAAVGTEIAWDSKLLSHGYSQAFEITYVDDEAIHLAATSSTSLMIAIPVLMRHLCKTFAYFGFQINWKPGKTECVLALRGKRAQETRSKLVQIDDGFAIPLPPDCGATSLRIVSEYKHLGSTIANNGAAVPDVPLRSTSALASSLFASGQKSIRRHPHSAHGQTSPVLLPSGLAAHLPRPHLE